MAFTVSNTIPNDDGIYLIENGKKSVLKQEDIVDYLKHICLEMKIQHLDVDKLASNVYPKLMHTNTIKDLDSQIVMSASDMGIDDDDYPRISVYILIRDLHNSTYSDYLKVVEILHANTNHRGNPAPIVNDDFLEFVKEHHEIINRVLCYDRDYQYDYFGFRTLEKSYLKRLSSGQIVERPQHMIMRKAICIHHSTNDIDRVIETYHHSSLGHFTHATPTLFNAGTTHQQLSSCFLFGIGDDMEMIGDCWKDCAVVSKYAGGIGINASNIRVNGAYINSTQGRSSGLRLLTVFNQIARYADQGGKRAGSIAIYIEPWHGDIRFFLDLRKNTGAETERARDLFLGLMINDIFMRRVEEDGIWSLMCPNDCPDILDKYGDEFEKAYTNYEAAGKYIKQISARDLWHHIMKTQIETGVPYLIFKDAVNKKSNQINLGVVNGSNLCVAGDTQLLTATGYHEIIDLVGQIVDVWNGREFSPALVRQTGVSNQMMRISFTNGNYIVCTPYHKFYVNKYGNVHQCDASTINIGDQLIECQMPIIVDGNTEYNDAYTNGQNAVQVPVNYHLTIRQEWLRGFMENHAVPVENGVVRMYHNNSNVIRDVARMLETMGCHPSTSRMNHTNTETPCYQLVVMDIELTDPDHASTVPKNNVYVSRIENIDSQMNTYCFTEQRRHMGVFNGIIAGNCAEIVEISSKDTYSVCNLASICLPKFVKNHNGKPEYDYHELVRVTRIITRNLDNIIDVNFYPVEKARVSNLKYRPIGIGVQGLADVFAMYDVPFDSPTARDLNKRIFETIYYGAMQESVQLSIERGPYQGFYGSPLSKGLFQFDLWGVDRSTLMWNWDKLTQDVMYFGVRNSLTTCCMPTASTSQIMGNTETMEPITSNIYSRTTMAGEFMVVNKHLIRKLRSIGMWNQDVVDIIKYYDGSIANVPGIPEHIKQVYRTAWEIPKKSIIEMAADRGPFVDQTQSMNLYIARPDYAVLNSCLFTGWRLGLKTGIYYLRSKAASDPNKFGIDIDKIREIEAGQVKVCKFVPKHLRKPGDCLQCSS